MSNGTPLIRLEEGGTAPVLRYDIPEPTSYEGKNFIELEFDGDIFTEAALEMPSLEGEQLGGQDIDVIRDEVADYLKSGVSKRPELVGIDDRFDVASTALVTLQAEVSDEVPPPTAAPGSLVDKIAGQVSVGRKLVPMRNLHGDVRVVPVPVATEPDPHLYLVETIRLTSFLGDYGAGRIVKTFTLLPGEVTRISVKTFRQRESTRKSASSVLDSFTQESADDLERSLQEEQSDTASFQKTREYNAEAEASGSWGFGSAKVTAGVKATSNAAREESVKNISNATRKHSSRASAKREVEVNTSFEVTEKEGEETSIEREVENINLSRTLNFVFRQMNQEFRSFLHLTDVRVGFFNGDGKSRREVPLSRLDQLLDEFVKEGSRSDVRQTILDQLEDVRDIDGVPTSVVRTVEVGPGDEYLSFDRRLNASHTDEDGRTYELPGVLLAADTHVMRTEGVMVEALLGNGPALDLFAEQLQELEVDRRTAEVEEVKAESRRAGLVNDIIASGDVQKAKAAERLTCCHDCCADTANGEVRQRPERAPQNA